jgi:hypothetical protein
VGAGRTVTRHEPLRGGPGSGGPLLEFAPFNSGRPVALLNLGWVWRLSEDRGFQLMATVGNEVLPSLAWYSQLLGGPVDFGLGVSLSAISPGAYSLIGKELRLKPSVAMRFDLGAHVEFVVGRGPGIFTYGPQALWTFAIGTFEVAFWGDLHQFSQPMVVDLCQDNCQKEDVVYRRVSAGLLFTQRFSQ